MRRKAQAFAAGSLAAFLIATAGGCAREEGNDEYFNRTAPPGVNGPPQDYAKGAGAQMPPAGGMTKGAPPAKGEAEAAPSPAAEGAAPSPAAEGAAPSPAAEAASAPEAPAPAPPGV